MRRLSLSLLGLAASASAQVVLPAPPSGSVVYAPGAATFNPAADYITIGQDEPGYRNWYAAAPAHGNSVRAFNAYLEQYDVGGVFPTWQLLRTATSWQRCGGQPFEVPPTSEWPHIVQTLRYVRDYVIPAVGPVEPVSAYRNPALNACAGGAPESAHKHYSAIDMVPLRQTTREDLMRTLCRVQARRGPDYQVGLGFYAFLRFHVDTTKYRRWNMDPTVASLCPPIAKSTDIATIAQPLPTISAASSGAAPVIATTPVEPAGPKVVFAPSAAPTGSSDSQPQQH
ncbi:D-Ala-D-Ala carboxypeptidase family metallohydrolase [Sphingomonas daechungensis]|uniref:D-Ala-D-Ala carboxypeptidase family metallohydrolase n=1 Tax=Sphingomonas daechungensis TaxID=1176646 RepID=UPI0037839206